ncbi:flagellar FlbD family protein [Bacillus testis]|uniref:flagellar FlbD family protein n=1 Tax=Bacillus testis TaxID=1622072 RepID=UPI00067F4B8C|nr:flagellar FlbD family protein [Bacillus testis]
MIKVTSLNGKPFSLNAMYIERIDYNPDTTITLTNGHKYLVRESEADMTAAISAFYRSIRVFGRQEIVGVQDEEE